MFPLPKQLFKSPLQYTDKAKRINEWTLLHSVHFRSRESYPMDLVRWWIQPKTSTKWPVNSSSIYWWPLQQEMRPLWTGDLSFYMRLEVLSEEVLKWQERRMRSHWGCCKYSHYTKSIGMSFGLENSHEVGVQLQKKRASANTSV